MLPETAFDGRVAKIMKRIGKLEDDEVVRAFNLLENLRRLVASRIVETEWDAHFVPQLQEAISRAVAGFGGQYEGQLTSGMREMIDAGIDAVDWPLASAGIKVSAPEISRTALELLQGHSIVLARGLTDDLGRKLNYEVSMGVLGGKTPFEVMTSIGRNLTDRGVFPSIAARAEAITRTEMARIHSNAREARMESVIAANPDRKWLKKWIHSKKKGQPRSSHVALNGVMVKVTEDFPGGRPYPHAPGLSASETVHCGCSHVLTLAEWEKLPKDWEPQQYQPRSDALASAA